MFDKLEHGNMDDIERQSEYLKLAGGALINWIRLNHPETYMED